MDETGPSTVHLDRPDVSHEGSDFSLRGVVIFCVVLVVLGVVLQVLLWLILRYWPLLGSTAKAPSSSTASNESRRQTLPIDPKMEGSLPLSPEMVRERRGLPPEPRLEGLTPRIEPLAMEGRQEKLTEQYAWVDPRKRIVRIPVEEAMKVLASKPPASSAQVAPKPAGELIPPQESNSGRTFELKSQSSGR